MLEKIKGFCVKKPNLSSFLSGSICALSFAPFHFFFAAVFSLSIFFFLLEKKNDVKKTFWLGFCYGFGYFLAGIYWICISLLVDAAKFAWLIPFALTLIPGLLATYFAALATLYKFLSKKFHLSKNYQKIILFSTCWLFFEVLRANLLSGFPWNLLGYTWLFDIRFAQLASIFGIYGLSFFACLLCLTPALFIKENLQKNFSFENKMFFIALLFFVVASGFYGIFAIEKNKITNDSQSVLRLVQANVQQEIKWQEGEKYKNFLKHIELTNSKNLNNVKAVIWSETSIPYVVDENPELLNLLANAVPQDGVLISGGLRLRYSDEEKTKISNVWNSIFVFEKDATEVAKTAKIKASYDKSHLVPFGEYVPLQKFLSFLFVDEVVDKIMGGGVGFSEGDGAQTIVSKDFSFNPLICYEVIFSREVLKKDQHPNLFINITNDSWFGTSTGPFQHLDMAKMRAIEYATPLVRVASTGISALIDPFGNVIDQLNLNEEGILDVPLIKNSSPTIYAKYGHWPLVLLIALLLSILLYQKSPGF